MGSNVVSVITPQVKNIKPPAFLRSLQGWLIWRYEASAGSNKLLKVPYYTDGGRRYGEQGGPVDCAKLSSWADASQAAAKRGFEGVGFALLPQWGVTALDFDACVDADGRLPAEIGAIVCTTYAEFSPSGKGIRAFVMGNLGNHKSTAEPGRYGIETFATSGYVTFTGRVLDVVEVCGLEDTVAPASEAVLSLVRQRFGDKKSTVVDANDPWAGFEPRLNLDVDKMCDLLSVLDADMPREEWIRVGMALHHETEGDDTGFELWDEWSATSSDKYPGREALRQQWDSFTRRMGPGKRQITMATVLKMVKNIGREESTTRPTQAATVDDLRTVAAEAEALREEAPAADGVQTPEGYAGKYPIMSARAARSRPPTSWLVKSVVPAADLIVMFGASGSGKSFVALDIAAAIARGVSWRGYRTKKGRVLVIAAEGGGGVGKRLEAYVRYHGVEAELDIGLITAAPNFLQQEDVSEIVTSVVAAGGVDLIIVDTFAQVTPGANENAGEDMGLALNHAKALREVSGAPVLLVHHAGKDASRGARGWSGIKAAADAEIEITRNDDGTREIHLSKMKDGDDGLRFGFKLHKLVLGQDSDGDEVSSCVVLEADVPTPATGGGERVKRLGKVESHVSEMVETIDPSVEIMDLIDFVDLCAAALTLEEGKRDTRKQNVTRAIENLAKLKDGPFTLKNRRVIFCK